MARETKAPKARALIPAMYNNMAWDLHDLKRYEEALVAFQKALEAEGYRGLPPTGTGSNKP